MKKIILTSLVLALWGAIIALCYVNIKNDTKDAIERSNRWYEISKKGDDDYYKNKENQLFDEYRYGVISEVDYYSKKLDYARDALEKSAKDLNTYIEAQTRLGNKLMMEEVQAKMSPFMTNKWLRICTSCLFGFGIPFIFIKRREENNNN